MQKRDFIESNFYVDDGLTSSDVTKDIIKLIQSTVDLCKKGNIRVHKFVSNNPEALQTLPESELGSGMTKLIKVDENLHRTLGLKWNTKTDEFLYEIDMPLQSNTRRSLLSSIASIFDPLGLITPVTIRGKILLQQCCKENLNWDQPLPEKLSSQWSTWCSSVNTIESINFRRCYKPDDFGDIVKGELHCFSDASSTAYGACVYLRLVNELGEATTTLVFAKSRVAPSNITTIPRLELQAAVLATSLVNFVKELLHNITINSTYYYTDSQIVLGYINNEVKRFHIFVANRVQEIRNSTMPEDWFYVPSSLNPADHASRGLTTSEMKTSSWNTGPPFLYIQPIFWPEQPVKPSMEELEATIEVRKAATSLRTETTTSILTRLERFSDWKRAVSLVSALQQHARRYNRTGPVDKVTSKRRAELTIIKMMQEKSFGDEIDCVLKNRPLAKSSSIYRLNPILDSEGILRVGGRLDASSYLDYNDKHPIILPKGCYLTRTIAHSIHDETAHQGKQSTLGQIRLRGYWIVGATSLVISIITNCITCKRIRKSTAGQQMATLPPKRIEPSPPFSYIGCDVFGPFHVKDRRTVIKRYGVIFTCMSSKAIHIEAMDDMTTDCFINTLRCLIAIRGPTRQIHTDRGTNFVGAAHELHRQLTKNKDLQKFSNKQNIEFVTNTPYSSHMGGIWERRIRAVRNALTGLLKGHEARLDSSSLRTLFYEVMALINCRPIAVANDGSILHPNMLLTMKSNVVLPPPGNFEESDVYCRKRWQQVQGLANEFWLRWKKEYLQSLQPRQKWSNKQPELSIGDLVLIKDDMIHRSEWPLGRITETIASKDGLIRKVKIALGTEHLDSKGKRITKQTHMVDRPIHKLVLIYRPDQ